MPNAPTRRSKHLIQHGSMRDTRNINFTTRLNFDGIQRGVNRRQRDLIGRQLHRPDLINHPLCEFIADRTLLLLRREHRFRRHHSHFIVHKNHAIPHQTRPRQTPAYRAMPRRASPHRASPHLTTPHPTVPDPATPYLSLPRPATPNPALPRPTLPAPASPRRPFPDPPPPRQPTPSRPAPHPSTPSLGFPPPTSPPPTTPRRA